MALVALPLLVALPSSVRAAEPFAECAEPGTTPDLSNPIVACQRVDSDALGGQVPFTYFVPEQCTDVDPCPVIYLLHGFGGDYRSMLGTEGSPSAFVQALTQRPPADPSTSSSPWALSRDGWVEADALRLVLVAPHGRTVPGGHGPSPGLDSFWIDWNPRYAAGGDSEAYATPPPRFSTHLVDELIPEIERLLPVIPGAASRALDGISLGGYGSYTNGLLRPDLWASVGSISGAHNFLFTPGVDPVAGPGPGRVGGDQQGPYVQVPGTSALVPLSSLPEQMRGFAVALVALGDPSADGAWYRGHMARDLALNARAEIDGEQVTRWRAFVNDAVPRRAEDFGPSYPVAQIFEDIVLPMNLEMDTAFANLGVARDFEIHPGLHSGVYWDPWLRGQLEHHAAQMDGVYGAVEFDYRSVLDQFEVWDWQFAVEREPVEFMHLWDVSCDRLTIQGSGRVTVTPPAACGAAPVTVHLGPSGPADEPAGVTGTPAAGWSVTVELG